MAAIMQFPPFDLLHWFIDNHTAKYNISLSDMLPATFDEVKIKLEDLNIAENFVNGRPELRQLLAEQSGVGSDNVIVTASCSEANLDVCMALLKPGDEAIAVMPNYPPLRDIPKGLGVKVKEFFLRPEDDFVIDLKALEKAVTKKTRLVIMTNINNPASSMVTKDQLAGIAEMAGEKDFHVLCDETFRELAFEKKPPTAVSFGDRMVVTNTMSKVYGMGGLKIGWILAKGNALDSIKNVTEYNTVCPSGISDRITLAVLQEKESFIERARSIIRRNKPVVEDWLDRNDKVNWNDPGVGNVGFPMVDADVDRLAAVLLKDYNTIMASGSFFGVKGRFRLGFGRKTEDLVTGLENFDLAMKSMA
jgi:aspartate/methionine/tyrosine aminotransferase